MRGHETSNTSPHLALSVQRGAEETLDRSVISHHLAEQFLQKYLAAQSNMCLSPKAHNLVTHLTFDLRGSFRGIKYFHEIPFKITKQGQYFLKCFSPFSKVILLSVFISS